MAELPTLVNLSNLQNETTAVNAINSNMSAIGTAFLDVLSRSGTSPNQMEDVLDMNSNAIINLPAPSTSNEPLRLQDLSSFVGGGTITNIPAGGSTNEVLKKASNSDYDVEWAASGGGNTIIPEEYGAVGDGVTDDTAAFVALTVAANALINVNIEFGSNKTYLIWPTNASANANQTLMLLSGLKSSVINFNGSKFKSTCTAPSGVIVCIFLSGCTNTVVNDYDHDASASGKSSSIGIGHILIYNGSNGIRVLNQKATGGVLGVYTSRALGSANARCYNIEITQNVTDVYYPLNFQADGDNIQANSRSVNAGRPYFPYNCSNHDIVLHTKNNTSQTLIACYATSASGETSATQGIRLKLCDTERSTVCGNAMVNFSWQQDIVNNTTTQVGRIDAEITLDVDQSNAAVGYGYAVSSASYLLSAPGVQALGNAAHIGNITVTGYIRGVGDPGGAIVQIGRSADGFGNSSKINWTFRDFIAYDYVTPTFQIGKGTSTNVLLEKVIMPSASLSLVDGAMTAGTLHLSQCKFANIDPSDVMSTQAFRISDISAKTLQFGADSGGGYVYSLGSSYLQFGVNSTFKVQLDSSGKFIPVATGGSQLGTASIKWADLHTTLATVYSSLVVGTAGSVGGQINFANAGNSNLVSLQPALSSSAYTFFFPSNIGTSGLPLLSQGAGNPHTYAVVGPAAGGTGVANNAASTLTISGNFATTLTVSASTGVTLPISGTLATLAGAETLTNKILTSPTITTGITPTTDDGAALGTTSLEFSDLFLASGGVINWVNGNARIIHSATTPVISFNTSSTDQSSGQGVNYTITMNNSGINTNMFAVRNSLTGVVTGTTTGVINGSFTVLDVNVFSAATLAAARSFITNIRFSGASPTGTITEATGFLIDNTANGSTGTPNVTVSNIYGLKINNQGAIASVTGFTAGPSHAINIAAQTNVDNTAYALVSAGAGLVDIGDTTDATNTTTAAVVLRGGLGVVKKSYFGDDINSIGNITFNTAAKTVVLKQGANGTCGTFVANGITPVTVSNTNVAITDAIIISLNTVGGTVGVQPHVATITASTGFTVVCTATDTSTYNYAIIKNAA